MKRHADFLALLYLAWGGIFALVCLAGLALMAGALVIARDHGPVAAPSDLAAGFTAFMFGVLSMLALLWAILHLWLGAALRRYRAWARLAALGLAVINLVLFPFGTALGAYACWVLLTNEGRNLFEGTMNPGTPEPGNPGTPEPRNPGTSEPRNLGT